ncbi:MAG: bifunctional UDP-N-acetylglucosamine diphosphorylase/glucosamine-1-phosphate N-acetyltransferase GlmU [Thermotogae bacterium]|nr:bifunctional UDP-N-acetylglucosamine diphosphorylase/glucosamine-1-phosphate N-acetyltransferase GlmU [Thermotogota bacterium]
MLRILILAAGKGKRMKSNIPKVLHKLLNKPMISWVVNTAKKLNPESIAVVLGHKAEEVRRILDEDINVFIQSELLGTGHAVMCAKDFLKFDGDVLILYGDVPNVKVETLKEMIEKHRMENNSMTILTTFLSNPRGYGRIVRNDSGKIISIIEETDADEEIKKIKEVNSGICVFKASDLINSLKYLKNDNKQGEYYLTDIVKIFLDSGKNVGTFLTEDPNEILGINDRMQLSKVERLLRLRVNEEHMLNGVTIVDPESTFIAPEVVIEMDTIIQPSTIIYGNTKIGRGCEIGPFTIIKDCTIENNVKIVQSNCEGAWIFSNTSIGPFARLRPKTTIKENVKIGNFVEVKNSIIEQDVKAGHLSYIGDSEVGEGTNIGAGTITCNYDGFMKHKTKIGKRVFIGSNSALVAPVMVGEGAIIGAGSVITEDVPNDSLGLGRARQVNKKGWAKRWREKKEKEVQGLKPKNKDA